MSAVDVPNHPANDGRGKPELECPAFRNVQAPLSCGPDHLNTTATQWRVDCSLEVGHATLHTDPSGATWESTTC
ncbi:hypothetical protein [Rhodococcoides fascians]|uniref:hypothetical protein n=1 Tax=Rhodococcoides fascians TaxID=1828 RepID=UPI00050CEBE3|nr:hypothetical protein [Rhodococcus fascians]